jgi:hypothetical protein
VAVHLLDMVPLISWVMGMEPLLVLLGTETVSVLLDMEPFVEPLRKDSPFELVDTEPFVGNLDNILRELRDMVNCGKFLDNWFVGMEDLAGEMDMVLTAEAAGTVS